MLAFLSGLPGSGPGKPWMDVEAVSPSLLPSFCSCLILGNVPFLPGLPFSFLKK